MARAEDLKDEQWALLEELLPALPRRAMGAGDPGGASARCLMGCCGFYRSGARWKDLPGGYPACRTCHRRYQRWVDSGAVRDVLEVLAEDLRERGLIDLSECYIDGTFIVAKKGGQPWAPPSGAKAATVELLDSARACIRQRHYL